MLNLQSVNQIPYPRNARKPPKYPVLKKPEAKKQEEQKRNNNITDIIKRGKKGSIMRHKSIDNLTGTYG